MTGDEPMHVGVGKIVVNLEALEFVLRLFLYESVGPKDPNFQFENVAAGDVVAETPLTNYHSLGDLIKITNAELERRGSSHRVDKSMVDVRDAFAHGRVVALNPEGPYRLVKFSRPRAGVVTTNAATVLTEDWLREQVRRTNEQVKLLTAAARELGLTCFPES